MRAHERRWEFYENRKVLFRLLGNTYAPLGSFTFYLRQGRTCLRSVMNTSQDLTHSYIFQSKCPVASTIEVEATSATVVTSAFSYHFDPPRMPDGGSFQWRLLPIHELFFVQ